jgi:vitamin B12 transporter
VAAVISAVPRAWAAEPIPLGEVTVRASALDEYVPAQTVIDQEELTEGRKSNLSQELELTPGVNVRVGGRGESRVDMRGFDQRAVLFTLNGVPIAEPYNGIINVNLFPIDMLENVVIDRGPSSALFGPNGMAGTIKLNTFAPRKPRAASVSTIWRDSNFWDSRASGALASQNGLTAFVGGRYLTTNGFPLSASFTDRPLGQQRWENGGLRLNSDREEWSVFTTVGYQPSDASRAHVTFLTSDAQFGIPPGTTDFAPVFRRTDQQTLTHVQTGIDRRLTPQIGVAGAAFYSNYVTRESQYDGPDFVTRVLSTETQSDEIGAIGRVTTDFGRYGSLALAGQVIESQADITDTARGRLAEPDFTTASVGTEYDYLPLEWLVLVFGLSNDLQTGGGRTTTSELNPQGGVSVDLGRYGNGRAGIARKVRFPTLRELFDPVQGNPDLNAEKTLVYEVGHRLATARYYVDTALFRNDVTDLIDSESGGQTPFTNFDEATLQGAEVAVGGTPHRRLRVDLNYTYLDATANDPRGGTSPIQHKPAHRFNGILRVLLPYAFRLRLEGLYSSDAIDRFGTDIKVDSFGVFNVQVARAVGTHLELFAGVDNILDADYEYRLGTPQPGRRAFAGLQARL